MHRFLNTPLKSHIHCCAQRLCCQQCSCPHGHRICSAGTSAPHEIRFAPAFALGFPRNTNHLSWGARVYRETPRFERVAGQFARGDIPPTAPPYCARAWRNSDTTLCRYVRKASESGPALFAITARRPDPYGHVQRLPTRSSRPLALTSISRQSTPRRQAFGCPERQRSLMRSRLRS